MATKVDELYAELELKTERFDAAITRTSASLATLDAGLSTTVPQASAAGSAALDRLAATFEKTATANEVVIAQLRNLNQSIELGIVRASAKGDAALRALADALERKAVASEKAADGSEDAARAERENTLMVERGIILAREGTQYASTRATSLQALIQIEQSLTRELRAENLTLEQTIRLEALRASAQRALASAMQATSATVTRAGSAAAMSGLQIGRSAASIAYAASSMAQAGAVGGDALSKLTAAGSALAGAFGPTGLVISAVLAGLAAIVAKFREARAEAEQSREEFIKALENKQNAGDVAGLTADARRAFEGTAAKGFSDGFNALRQRAEEASAAYDTMVARGFATFAAGLRAKRDAAHREFDALQKRLADLQAAILAPGPGLGLPRDPVRVTVPGAVDPAIAARKRQDEIDAANKGLDDLNKKARASGAAIQAAIGEAATALAKLTGDAVAVLDGEMAKLIKLHKENGASAEDLRKIVLPLQLAKNEALALNGALRRIDVHPDVQRRLEEAGKKIGERAEENVKKADALAFSYEDAATAALGIATALVGANSELTRTLQGAAQLAASFGRIGDLAKEAGGLGKLFDTPGGIASALPALGGIIGGIGLLASSLRGLLGGRSPEQERARQLLEENNRRLADLRDGLIDVLALRTGGRDAQRLRDVQFFEEREGPRDEYTGEPTTVTVNRDVRDVLAELAALGVSLADLRQLAKDLGVEFKGLTPTFDELVTVAGLASANLERILKQFRDTIDGQLDANKIRQRINPEKSPLDNLLADLDVLGGPKGAGIFKEIRESIAAGDFEGAKQKIRDFIDAFIRGEIDLEALGDIDPTKIVGYLEAIFNGILAATPKVKTAAEQFTEAVEAYDLAVERGTLTAEERAAKLKAKAADLFPDLFTQLDFSSAEKFRESFQKIADGFAADGELSDAEREQLAIIEALGQAFGYLTDEMEDAQAAAQAFADAVRAAFDDIDFDLDVHGITDPIERFKRTINGLRTLFPELGAIFDQFDINTAEGRKAAEAAYVAWAQGLTDPAARAAVLRILGSLRDIPDPAAVDAEAAQRSARESSNVQRSGVQTITERTGNVLVELTRNGYVQRNEMLGIMRSIASTLGASGGLVAPPATSLGFGAGVGGAGSGVLVQNRIDARVYIQRIELSAARELPADLGRQVEASVRDGINKGLASDFLDYRAFQGGYR